MPAVIPIKINAFSKIIKVKMENILEADKDDVTSSDLIHIEFSRTTRAHLCWLFSLITKE